MPLNQQFQYHFSLGSIQFVHAFIVGENKLNIKHYFQFELFDSLMLHERMSKEFLVIVLELNSLHSILE